MGNIVENISSKSFNALSIVSDVIFFLSMAFLISYTTFISKTMTWEMGIAIAFLTLCYSLFFLKKPDFENLFDENDE